MEKLRSHVPIGLPISAIVLLVVGFAIGPIIESRYSEEVLAQNVILKAIPFILVFVSIILIYMTLVWLMVSLLSNKVPPRIYRWVEVIAIAGIAAGIVGIFQPWAIGYYRYGFLVLLISTLFYIGWSHLTPKGAFRGEHLGRRSERTAAASVAEVEREEAAGGTI